MQLNFPTDNLYKFIALFGLTLLSYGLISENKYTDLAYKKTSEINSLWKKVRILDYEHTNLREKFTDSLDKVKQIKDDLHQMNLYHKEMEFLASDLKELSKMEANVNNKNRWISVFGIIILLIGFYLWYKKTQKKLDNLN